MKKEEILTILLILAFILFGLVWTAQGQVILPATTPLKHAVGYLESTQGADAIHCIMGEARGEGYKGMVAVGEALRNRGTMKGVYGCHAKFTEPQWVWDMAEKAWNASKRTNFVKGGTHWESTDYKVPYWASSMIETAHIRKHIFYKEKP